MAFHNSGPRGSIRSRDLGMGQIQPEEEQMKFFKYAGFFTLGFITGWAFCAFLNPQIIGNEDGNPDV